MNRKEAIEKAIEHLNRIKSLDEVEGDGFILFISNPNDYLSIGGISMRDLYSILSNEIGKMFHEIKPFFVKHNFIIELFGDVCLKLLTIKELFVNAGADVNKESNHKVH